MGFKEAIQEYGKEISASFTCGGVSYGSEDIISMNPHYEGSLLRSVMKCLDIELKSSAIGGSEAIAGIAVAGESVAGVSDVGDASIIYTPRFGVKAPNDTDYSYIEYGTYIVKEKKSGVKCIGCPAGGNCSGNCAGNSGNCNGCRSNTNESD